MAGVRSLLTLLAAERPLLLAIDDLQWLDTASAAALEFAISRLGREHIGVLATRRLGEPARLDLAALVPREALSSERGGPLSLGALQRLLRERFGEALPRSTRVRIHGTSGGNPLFALEIGRILAERGTPPGGEPPPVPDDAARSSASAWRRCPTRPGICCSRPPCSRTRASRPSAAPWTTTRR